MRNPVRPVALLLTAALALVGVVAPTPAFAHAALLESDPAQGAQLDETPQEVTFSFNEDVAEPAYIVVTAAGDRVEQGSPDVDGGTVTQRVATDARSGAWTMAYRVVSTDGHPITGEISFSVADSETPAEPTRAGAPESRDVTEGEQSRQAAQVTETQEASLWARHGERVVVGTGLLALAAGVLLLVRRRSA